MNEAKTYQALSGGEGIPKLYWYGIEGNFNIMVFELLGDSLDKLIKEKSKLPMEQGLLILEQLVIRVF